MNDELRDQEMRSKTQISEQLDERLTMNDNKRYLLLNNNFNDITYHNYSNTQMKVYAKNCFDRFGDDLTEEILQYLTFEDKVRLECVSKQWRRLVFNKQFVIEFLNSGHKNKNSLNGLYRGIGRRKKLNKKLLKSVLKKCPNITDVKIRRGINSSVLSLIGRYCPNIKSLTFGESIGSDEEVLSFFRMYGHKLEELVIVKEDCSNRRVLNMDNNDDNIVVIDNDQVVEEVILIELNVKNYKHFYEFCPNIRRISFPRKPRNSIVLDKRKEFLPQLQQMKYLWIFSKGLENMKILSDKYSKTIKILDITLTYMNLKELKTCIECIARFENLKELKLRIDSATITQPIDDCLSLIGQKCNKLLKLDLSIYSGFPISQQFLRKVLSGSVECFKHCKQLKHLYIRNDELREDFFANIASFVPKIQSLSIETDKQFSDSFINLFQSMKYIQKVKHYLREDRNNLEIRQQNCCYSREPKL